MFSTTQFSTNSNILCVLLQLLLFLMCLFSRKVEGATITILNKCDYTLWPGILSNAGSSGFELRPGQSSSIQAGPGWSGRVWARTQCNFNPVSGQGTCLTGDCGSGRVECGGSAARPPATLAEFTIGSGPGSGSEDYYDVSLVDGFNVPMGISPVGGSGSGSGSCMMTDCGVDLNQHCPNELRVGSGEACRSACDAYGSDEYCCSGAYGTPATCTSTVYSKMFKTWCPRAYSYAYDDATSTFTCTGSDYTVTFCPASSSQGKSTKDYQPPYTGEPILSGFGSGSGYGSGSQSMPEPVPKSSSKHSPTFFLGGGQMISSSAPIVSLLIHSKFAWQLNLIIFLQLLTLFLCHFN